MRILWFKKYIEYLEKLLQYLDSKKCVSVLKDNMYNSINHIAIRFAFHNIRENNYRNKKI